MAVKKKKSGFDKMFYVLGTIILVITLSIVVFNFRRDSRFSKSSVISAFNERIVQNIGN